MAERQSALDTGAITGNPALYKLTTDCIMLGDRSVRSNGVIRPIRSRKLARICLSEQCSEIPRFEVPLESTHRSRKCMLSPSRSCKDE